MIPSLSDRLLELMQAGRATAVGLAAYHPGRDEEILIEPDRPFHPASTFKICVMMELFHQARLGRLALKDTVPIRNQFLSIADGSPYALQAEDDSEKDLYAHVGETFSFQELVHRMITLSSNLATNVLLEYIHPRQVTDFMRQLGTEDLIVVRGVEDNRAYRQGMNNSASARGFMQILLRLIRGEVVSAGDSDAMIGLLGKQRFNEMIPAGLPPLTRVAHKTGWTGDHYHDVGIVYPRAGEPFVLSILTKGYDEAERTAAHAFVASLARMVYDHWNPPLR